MDLKILNAALKITQQRDLDELEQQLISTLAELIPANTISLIKFTAENNIESTEEVMGLSILVTKALGKQYTWSTEAKKFSLDTQLKQSLRLKHTVLDQGQQRLLIPISRNRNVSGCLCVTAENSMDNSTTHDVNDNITENVAENVTENLVSYQAIIEGFVRLYENHWFVLNESERDMLTGLLNRRTFDKKLDRLLQAQRRKRNQYGIPNNREERRNLEPESCAWLVILDIDNFKLVNDTYGHVFGDEVILNVSQIMVECFRSSDLLFRFGGEEFVIVLEPIHIEKAQQALNRFRNTIEKHSFPQISKITISIGFAKIKELDYPLIILERADQALYYAKEHGRNRVCNYETLIENGELQTTPKSGSVDIF